MNWYKQSKIVDIEPDNTERNVFVVCPGCGRWATNGSGSKKDNFDWKFYYQMNPEEQAIIDKSKYQDMQGSHAFATQICNFCKERKTI